MAEPRAIAWNKSGLTPRASGAAGTAGSVSAVLDSTNLGSVAVGNGRWYADLNLGNGVHTLAATGYYPAGQFSSTATSTFNVVGTNTVTDSYDGAGNLISRVFAGQKTQKLTWDGLGRLVGVVQRDNSNNGFNWSATYDGLGRRLGTVNTPVVNGQANSAVTLTIDSFYDPRVEFQELGVAVNGQRTWKVMGPDLNGRYGGMQGVGGLEATICESSGLMTGALNDYFGNVLATINVQQGAVNWSPVRVTGYGPALGYQAPALSGSVPLAEALVWRSRRIDPTGFYCLGARYYDPVSARFLSPDPLGHAASMDLYSFAHGDPVNQFDPSGRLGKSSSLSGPGATATASDWLQMQQDQLDEQFTHDALHEAFLDEIAGQHVTVEGLVDALATIGFGVVTMPLNMPLAYGSSINTMVSGLDDQGNQVSGWERAWATANVLLPVASVYGGEIIQAGIQGYRELGIATEGVEDTSLAVEETAFPRGGGCFAAGTKISTPAGDLNIEDVKSGDIVYAYDFGERKVVEGTVAKTHQHFTYHWVDIEMDGETIHATRSHPFWVESEQRWLKAIDLRPKMEVRCSSGKMAAITAIEVRDLDRPETTFNFEVSRQHNYFVGDSHILVHNGDGSYTITFQSGRTYSGKGDAARAADSAASINAQTGDPVVTIDWTPANGTADSFVQEEMRLRATGGPGGNTYNQINSPGNKIAAAAGCP